MVVQRYATGVALLLLLGACTATDDATTDTEPVTIVSSTVPRATIVEAPTFEEMQDALEVAMVDGSEIEECPFEVTSGAFTDVLGEVFEVPRRPWSAFASGRLDGSDVLPRCTVEWGRELPSVYVTAARKPYSGVAGFITGPRAISAGEDSEHVACRTTLVLGEFDVIVEVEQRFTECSAVEPIAERLVLAAATSLVTTSG